MNTVPPNQNEVADGGQWTAMGWVSHLRTFEPTAMPRIYEGFIPAPDPFGVDFNRGGPNEDNGVDDGDEDGENDENYDGNGSRNKMRQPRRGLGVNASSTIELPSYPSSPPGSEEDPSTPGSSDDSSADDADTPVNEQSDGITAPASDVPSIHPPQPRRRRGRPTIKKRTGERGGWSKGQKLGPHAPLEPSQEFTVLFQQAMHAFSFRSDLDTAHELVLQALAINPEVFNAHILLADIWFARDHTLNAVSALWAGAHCFWRDPFVWHMVIEACLERATYARQIALNQAKYALKMLLKLDNNDQDARFQLAVVEREAGKPKKALGLVDKILQAMPHNTDALGLYADICIGMQKNDVAINRYKEAIQYYRSVGLDESDAFEWADVSMYVKLLSLREGDRDEVLSSSIKVLKKLSRWLLGRAAETFWDNVDGDDREFDAEDYPRRQEIRSFTPGRYTVEQYGLGLPMQLRTQLGILRLRQGDLREEALAHFEWLEPDDVSEDANIVHFGSEFLEVARALNEAMEHREALRYFDALLRVDVVKKADFWIGIGTSTYILGQKDRAMEHFQSALACDADSIVAKTYVSRILTERGQKLHAVRYACEAVEEAADRAPPTTAGVRKYERFEDRANREAAENALKTALKLPGPNPSKKRQGKVRQDGTILNAFELLKPRGRLHKRKGGQSKRPPREPTPTEDKPQKLDEIRPLYNNMLNNYDMMKRGDGVATRIWMSCAKSLINDFRANEVLCPKERHAQAAARASRRRSDSGTPQADGNEADQPLPSIEPQANTFIPPTTYREISMTEWLDIFLQYSILCTTLPIAEFPNAKRDSYNIMQAATLSAVWSHTPAALFQIHACYLACAVAFRDQIVLFGTVLPWFLQQFPFATDAYRLFNAMHSLFPYSSDPDGKAGVMRNAYVAKSHKPSRLLFRHLSSLDHQLHDDYADPVDGPVPDFMRRPRDDLLTVWDPTPDPTTGAPRPRRTHEMDVVLLVLYGQLVYAKGAFTSALGYLHRANALRPREPLVLLTMALCYLQQPLKVGFKADNKHSWVLQGMALFEEYARARMEWGREMEQVLGWSGAEADCRREIAFNRARCWGMLGLGGLAVEGFKRVLEDEDREVKGKEKVGDDMEIDGRGDNGADGLDMQAAYAVATTYALSGDVEAARRVTERYLVVE
ncbi:uncharacterized protein HMPREF1541_02423 [Cyphellophora europaea CBS 101466]|uniref:TPR-like protein n=1 Tax=Cyphellophora europaea (strain CBS 101466) TaxID=1220924 RepID=W2S5N9_CYPE1|nr:uncharacterized protein HMPREF1541_02423 [Cyphellophora europaea CBS 101466]ETN43264.1 hypothetical protein HMPREF1541_02423 [Cyphellophora europaea CBS 101466]